MSMNEIGNENAMKANATRARVYTIHTTQVYTKKNHEHVPSKPTTTSMMKQGIDMYANAQTTMCAECASNNVVSIEFSKK